MPIDSIEEVFEAFSKLKVIVIGDIMLDVYQHGSVERMSPENPKIPVFLTSSEECQLGGAANVANNIKQLGAEPILIGPIGQDSSGGQLRRLLEAEGISSTTLLECADRKTTIKRRFLANGVQLWRVDTEDAFDISLQQSDAILQALQSHWASADLLILQDYNKGALTENLISDVRKLAKDYSVPIAVDPKIKNFLNYHAVDLFKPNLKELQTGLGQNSVDVSLESLNNATEHFMKNRQHKRLMVSLSEHGIYYNDGSESGILPADQHQIVDVSGAGDTVLALAAMCLSLGMSARFSSVISNLAAGLVCLEQGVRPIDKSALYAATKRKNGLMNILS
ncbi:MAG: D-glycero-beta-D-manno-heptose-7-phosphate kinase [Cyclobacteriaceae bacterium]